MKDYVTYSSGCRESCPTGPTQDVEPMAHALDIQNALAEDESRPSLSRNEVLKNAPKHDEEYFLVPAVLGE